MKTKQQGQVARLIGNAKVGEHEVEVFDSFDGDLIVVRLFGDLTYAHRTELVDFKSRVTDVGEHLREWTDNSLAKTPEHFASFLGVSISSFKSARDAELSKRAEIEAKAEAERAQAAAAEAEADAERLAEEERQSKVREEERTVSMQRLVREEVRKALQEARLKPVEEAQPATVEAPAAEPEKVAATVEESVEAPIEASEMAPVVEAPVSETEVVAPVVEAPAEDVTEPKSE